MIRHSSRDVQIVGVACRSLEGLGGLITCPDTPASLALPSSSFRRSRPPVKLGAQCTD